VRRQDFSFDLPEELIAQSPLSERSASRLLVLDGATGAIADRAMGDLPLYLRAGDLLVFNDTRVVAARIVGSKPSGGRVEIFLERVTAEAGREALVQLRASKPIREGLEIITPGGIVRVVGREDELWRVEVPGPSEALEFFESWGEVPLPPYIHRSADANDRERYQSIFAREKGAVAAPTASLHFDAPLVAKLEAMGVARAFVTLHVGAGTFQPLRTDDLDAHKMHAERVSVSAATWDAIRRTREAGGRVIAVGTTVVRALESAALNMPEFIASHLSETDSSGPRESAADGARKAAPPAADDVREAARAPADGIRKPEPLAADSTRGAAHHSADHARKAVLLSPGDLPEAARAAVDGTRKAAHSVAEYVRKAVHLVASDVPEVERSAADDMPKGTPLAEDHGRKPAPPATPPTWSSETRLFIRPGFEFQLVDAMVTNFHLPESTLLMLVSAFAGREHVLAAYAHAVRERYRFFSYGDAMLVMPTHVRPSSARTTRATYAPTRGQAPS
jgi:S-adenosylmethionine:tRNA ribosyltransferase-isomerase